MVRYWLRAAAPSAIPPIASSGDPGHLREALRQEAERQVGGEGRRQIGREPRRGAADGAKAEPDARRRGERRRGFRVRTRSRTARRGASSSAAGRRRRRAPPCRRRVRSPAAAGRAGPGWRRRRWPGRAAPRLPSLAWNIRRASVGDDGEQRAARARISADRRPTDVAHRPFEVGDGEGQHRDAGEQRRRDRGPSRWRRRRRRPSSISVRA